MNLSWCCILQEVTWTSVSILRVRSLPFDYGGAANGIFFLSFFFLGVYGVGDNLVYIVQFSSVSWPWSDWSFSAHIGSCWNIHRLDCSVNFLNKHA